MKNRIKNIISILIFIYPTFGFSQWIDITVDTTKFYKVIKFKNQYDGLIVGDSSTILKTSNGGNTWNFINYSINTNFNNFQYINDTLVYAYSADKIIKSENLGNTWTYLNLLPSNTTIVNFRNKTIGFAGGENGLFKSNDEGLNWDTVWNYNEGQYGYGIIQDIEFVNDTIGFACGSKHISGGGWYGIILRTTNSGNSWNEVYNNSPWGDFIDKINIVNNIVYGLINTGDILKTLDLGSNWTDINTNLDSVISNIKSVYYKNNDTAYIVSSPSIWIPEDCNSKRKIIRTTNGWQTWITQYLDITSLCQDGLLNSIYFSNDTIGFAVGYKKILRTNNCGGNINIIDTMSYQKIEKINSAETRLFTIYPNPSEDYIHIKSIVNDNIEIELTNIFGELLFKSIIIQNNQTIDMTKFNSGIYFIKIKTGLITKIEKLVKK